MGMGSAPHAWTRSVWCVRVFLLRLAHFRVALRTGARRRLEYDVFYHISKESSPERILSIGVAPYTTFYPRLFPNAAFVTIDRDAECASCGSPRGHVVGDATELGKYWPPATFDTVICNGVYGWGIDTEEQLRRLLASIHTVLAPGGGLLFGWNPVEGLDPIELESRREQLFRDFIPSSLSGREFVDVSSILDHRFRFFRKPDEHG